MAQAKIARKMQAGFLETAKKYGIHIGVDNGELAELMMNYVCELVNGTPALLDMVVEKIMDNE